jgi:hypothetical protein
MKKLIIAFGALLALFSMMSCIGGSQDNNQPTEQPTDSIESDTIEVSGLAIDGAKNSVALLVGTDTLIFDYPDLDADHRQGWVIGDSVTVRYYATESGDSVVTDVIKNDDIS